MLVVVGGEIGRCSNFDYSFRGTKKVRTEHTLSRVRVLKLRGCLRIR